MPIEISPASSSEQALVCRAAGRTRDFFRSHGIEIQRPIRIHLQQDELSDHANHIGLYDLRDDAIRMVNLDHASNHCREAPPFNVKMDRAMYASFVSHEVAHAIASQNSTDQALSLLAQEYLAYVTQFSSMPEKVRTRILQRYDVQPFAAIEDMSLTYYQLAPNAFGVKSFLHYRAVKDKPRFIRDLISGTIKPQGYHADW